MRGSERREVRRELHRRRLGVRDPRCQRCGESEPAALQRRGTEIVCFACVAEGDGRSTVEGHHYAGKANDSVRVPIPVNAHRTVSDEQLTWDTRTLRNPAGSGLRAAAAALRGRAAVERQMVERIDSWVPDWLEQLDEKLTERFGEKWWEELGLQSPPVLL
jgi:hypothetical protein